MPVVSIWKPVAITNKKDMKQIMAQYIMIDILSFKNKMLTDLVSAYTAAFLQLIIP